MKGIVITGLVALALAAPVAAHHSISAEFDMNRPVTFTGTVSRIEWTNPHIYTHVQVKEADGKVTEYRVEGGPPNALYRAGWRKDTLKVGDTVTVSGLRAKIATSTNIGVANITTADGKRVFATGGGGAAPAAQQ
jgi:DNA/RNA endonuclease YhcR with UshA esterase domain